MELITPYFNEGVILKRNLNDIKNSINNFLIAEKNGEIVGCTAVKPFNNGLFEIRSLVVSREYIGKGIGSALIAYAVDFVQNIQESRRIFALTLRPNVFKNIGFKLVLKDMFPEKVWSDCEYCVKKNNCDEIAVLYDFEGNS
ncbi:MAG: GNAT family N-acetyltransferase [Victivallales bacterium]|nr:GNAT family N-acetyltransferase [Victivallales bacterium]